VIRLEQLERHTKQERLFGPDAGGEGSDLGEAEAFVEVDGGAVFGGDGEREFGELLRAQCFGGGEHQDAAEAVALKAGHHADLRGVTDAGGDFAGQDRPSEFLAFGMM